MFREWLDSIATSGETVRLEDRMMKTTVDIIGRAVFGKRLNCQTTDSELYRIMKHSTSLLITDYSPGAMLNVLNPMRPIHLWRNNRRFKQVCMPYIMENVRNSQNPKQGGKTILDLAIRSYLKEHPEEKNIDSAWTDIALSQFVSLRGSVDSERWTRAVVALRSYSEVELQFVLTSDAENIPFRRTRHDHEHALLHLCPPPL